jgi:hypothetical protein
MGQIFAKLVLSSAIVLSGPLAAYAAHGTPIQSHAASGAATHALASAPKAAGAPATNGLTPLPDGLCCSGLTVIPPDTQMRAPLVPTGPGMPGQPAPIGTVTTMPNG